MCRVVNIAVLVSLPILSAILLEYWHDYRRYFSSVISKWVSPILFQLFFANTRYQYFCQQAAPLRLLHNNNQGTLSPMSACAHAVTPWCTVQGDVNYMRWTHVLGSVRMEEQVSRLSQQTQKRLI